LLQELDLRRLAAQRGACEECRSEERCEDGDEKRAHGQAPGVCRTIRRPQIFVGRHISDTAFLTRVEGECA
jgi:hypothetical protein